MKSFHYLIIFCLSLFLLTCSPTQTTLHELDINKQDYNLKKIAVLFVSNIYDDRILFEDEITYWLKRNRYNARASHKLFEEKSLPDKLDFAQMLKENDFDGVLIIKLSAIDDRKRYINTQDRFTTNPNEPTFYNYLDSYQNKYNTGYTFREKVYETVAQLFTSDNPELIYESSSKTMDSTNFEQAVEAYAKSVAKSLKNSKLLQKK